MKAPDSTVPTPVRAAIISTGIYLPSRILTNAELEKMVETTDEWIVTRTGIRERRLAAEGEFTSDMAAHAAQQAMHHAGIVPTEIDLIIVATCTPDRIFPSTACFVQQKLGATRAAAYDLQAACSGFLYSFITAAQFVQTGLYRTVLVVGAEKLSSIVNWQDRNTCVLFGDGAGAAIIQAAPSDSNRGLLACDLGADGEQTEILQLPAGGCRMPITEHALREQQNCLQMTGKEVYRHAVQRMNESVETCLARANVAASEIACLIPHQANYRIIESVASRLKLPMDQVFMNLDRYGNMSAACIPVALHEAKAQDRIKNGDLVLMTAFGGGLTWASALMRV